MPRKPSPPEAPAGGADDASVAVVAQLDGMPFAAWMEREGLSRSTAYKYAAALGIRRPSRHNPATGRDEPWLSQPDAEALTAYARALKEGAKPAEALVLVGRGALVPPQAPAPDPGNPPESVDPIRERERLELLALRLKALREAVELGAPLTRQEAADLLGVLPGASVGESVGRAGIEAHHLSRGVWQLRRAGQRRERW